MLNLFLMGDEINFLSILALIVLSLIGIHRVVEIKLKRYKEQKRLDEAFERANGKNKGFR